MTIQIEFKFRPAQQAPTYADVSSVVDYLAARPDWHTAKDISTALGISDRYIRKIAEHSRGKIISAPGCPGYKHADHCTTDELSEVAARLESQARHMQSRAVQIRKLAHASIH